MQYETTNILPRLRIIFHNFPPQIMTLSILVLCQVKDGLSPSVSLFLLSHSKPRRGPGWNSFPRE